MHPKRCHNCNRALVQALNSPGSSWHKKRFCNAKCKRAYHHVPAVKKTALERFEDKYAPEPNSGCWLWLSSLRDGYGTFRVGRKMVPAHRFSYEAQFGAVAEGLVLDHLCRVRCCVNPQHLEPVTNQVNVKRGAELKTHCPQGHPYSGENLYLYKGRHRICRKCTRLHNRSRSRSAGDEVSAEERKEP